MPKETITLEVIPVLPQLTPIQHRGIQFIAAQMEARVMGYARIKTTPVEAVQDALCAVIGWNDCDRGHKWYVWCDVTQWGTISDEYTLNVVYPTVVGA